MWADALVEPDGLRHQPVQMRGSQASVARDAEPVVPQAVNDNPDDVHSILHAV
jgi:hypothetical protein